MNCAAHVKTQFGWRPRKCSRQALEGGSYCKIHDPDAKRARAEKRYEPVAQRMKASDEAEARARALIARLGAGRPHYQYGFGSRAGMYTGGVSLTEGEVMQILERLRA